MLKNKKTYYQLILDKSGSMQSCREDTIASFNEQIQMIKRLDKKYPEQEILYSLTVFNEEVQFPIKDVSINKVKEISSSMYKPNGMTALYDAIGKSVIALENRIKDVVDKDEASVVVVIVTDGHENSSTTFDYETIRRLIGNLEEHPNWTFSYLGATLDAVEIARSLNIKENNSMLYDTSKIHETGAMLNDSIENYISAKSIGKVEKSFLRK